MLQRGLVLAGVLLASLTFCMTAIAGEASSDMKEVLARLKALEDKNKQLEDQNKQLSSAISGGGKAAIDRTMEKYDAQMAHVITAPDPNCNRPLKIGGYLDFSYEYNLTRPDNQQNNLRTFDKDSNGFNLHLAEINFERLPTEAGQAGFRIDTDFGNDARFTASQDNTGAPTSRTDDFNVVDLQQAYIEYIAPIGNGITIDAGKFVTWSGAEVIESSDNINSSRSFLFGLAIPFAHTGIRATYPVFKGGDCGGGWTVGLGVVNGWDNIQDQNDAKTGILLSNWQVLKWWNWTVTGAVGDESYVDERVRFAGATAGATLNGDAGDFEATFDDITAPGAASVQLQGRNFDSHNHGVRALFDTTMTFTPWEKFTFVANADYGQEGSLPNGYSARRNRDWYGVAGYVKYQFSKKWYVAGRYEYFNDPDGARTGSRQALQSGTITTDWALSDPLHIRFEYRHDMANVDSFSDTKGIGNGGVNQVRPFRSDSQDTIMMQWLYKF
jgi:hypothetical protein